MRVVSRPLNEAALDTHSTLREVLSARIGYHLRPVPLLALLHKPLKQQLAFGWRIDADSSVAVVIVAVSEWKVEGVLAWVSL